MKAVEVIWKDAYDINAWFSRVELDAALAEKAKSGICRSRGWLYFEDEERVVLAMTLQPDVERMDEESLAGILVIPRGMVIEIKEENNDEPANP